MRPGTWRAGLLALGLLVPPAMASADSTNFWPATAASRTAAQNRLERLQNALLQEPSATLVLERWCAEYHLAPDPKIIAQRVEGPAREAPAAVRRNLQLRPGEALGYRRVQLFCGPHILSDADNWYVPDRLTPAMNALLDHTDTPFGLAVKSLHFQRRTISSERLWSPMAAPIAGALAIPAHVLRNIGLLSTPDGLPISEVIENYTGAVLGRGPH